MSFISAQFVALFAVVLAVYWALPARRVQNVVLAAASLVFYGWVHPWFVLLLLFSAALDYGCALGASRGGPAARRYVLASVTGNLAVLAVFKYHGFFVDNLAHVLHALGVHAHLGTLNVLMPVGISFYTFQTMGYTLDVAAGRTRARTDFLDLLVYVAFFPQLVAGPIERPADLLPQLEQPRRLVPRQLASGLSLALWGAFKKVCVADLIAHEVDLVFLVDHPSPALVWAGAFGFGVQLYADFSGYTDIARGTARMLGIELSVNFHRPFAAASTPAFWRGWHMTLTRWIGDHVFAPLMSMRPRSGPWLAACLMITFLVLGLWHGASWSFVVFGLYQGAWMVVYTFAAPLVPAALSRSRVAYVAAVLFHWIVVLLPSALLFREPVLSRVAAAIVQLPWHTQPYEVDAAVGVMGTFVVGAAVLATGASAGAVLGPRAAASRWGVVADGVWWAAACVAIVLLVRDTSVDFIYFAF